MPNAHPHPTSPAPAAERARRRRRRLATGLAALVLLGAGAAYGWHLWRLSRPAPELWIAAAVQRGDIEDLVSATGSLQPRDYVDVGAQISGQLKKIHVEVGSEVNEGDLLAEIDAEQAAARVEASRAELRALQAQLVEREVALVKAQRDWQRQKNLMAEDATTAETLQNAETTLRAARAQIDSLKAQMASLAATMRVNEANLNYTKIYAPMTGTVVSITARQGQTLNTNQSAPTILRVADLSTMQVQTQVSEADVSRLRLGMPVYFTTLGSQGRRWTGTLKKIEPTPTVTNNVVLYNALFEVPNQNRSLMPQMTAQVFFVVAEVRDVLVVPMAALTLQPVPRPDGASGRPGADATVARAGVTATAGTAADRPSPGGPGAGLAAAGGPAATASGPGGNAPPRFDREAWQQMSEAERERLRAARRAERAARGEGGAGTDATGARGPRHATVKLIAADGSGTQEREVTIGVNNRVQAQVLTGLQEGERVVAGVRAPEPARNASPGNQRVLGQQPPGTPGFGPPPGGR